MRVVYSITPLTFRPMGMFCAQGQLKCLSHSDDKCFGISGLACAHGVGLSHQDVFPWRDALDFKGAVFLNLAGTTPGAGTRAALRFQFHDKLTRGWITGGVQDLALDRPGAGDHQFDLLILGPGSA